MDCGPYSTSIGAKLNGKVYLGCLFAVGGKLYLFQIHNEDKYTRSINQKQNTHLDATRSSLNYSKVNLIPGHGIRNKVQYVSATTLRTSISQSYTNNTTARIPQEQIKYPYMGHHENEVMFLF